MKAGDRISIHCAKSYAPNAIVASICPIEDLPDLPGMQAAEVRATLQDGHFVNVALPP